MPSFLLLLAAGCAVAPPPLDRATFNRRAAEANLPLHWRADTDGVLTPDELAVTWPAERSTYVADDTFTPAFEAARGVLRAWDDAPPSDPRRAALREELRSATPALVSVDLRDLSPGESALVAHVGAAARHVEALYLLQRGAAAVTPAPDAESRAVFARNQGPWCEAPAIRDRPECSATVAPTPRVWGWYPPGWASEPDVCARLGALPEALSDPFSVVVERDGALVAVPYTEMWRDEMEAVARELEAASRALAPEEPALRAYLDAAAGAWRTNDWPVADEAWSRMNATNSRWYLRIAPDEVLADPCRLHAAFHVSFARVNQDSLRWQRVLEPEKAAMESVLATLAGPPYAARAVEFHLPDFVDIVLNAGDSRDSSGGTIGQSLPNWGPVADEGRGRTVAMTNLGQDPDSIAALERGARSLLCADAAADWTNDPEPLLVSTVLHEAAHNLGPTSSHRPDGRSDVMAMGGPTAATMEELKAQSAAMYLMDWLVARGLADPDLGRRAHLADLVWIFGQIAQGMTDGGDPLPYPQLSAIQLGMLLEAGAVTWRPGEPAANGTDRGCLGVDGSAWPAAVEGMTRTVLTLKSTNDATTAAALLARHVGGDGPGVPLHATIAERIRREPQPVYVYEVW